MMYGTVFDMWWIWLFGAVAVAGLIVLVVVIVRVAGGGIKQNQQPGSTPISPGPHGTSTPRQILDERYARGEMTTEEYRERLTALNEGR
ncbi:SHOCT domain-containing protein [Glaciibacter psychrotolerans]|uniref:Putative membrane protein n=1 Tax=Glaciibacter psychrotolerans TaxID=670054 RepID=A0A7Z0ED22_9MICO|nr:SHOCT domain-containing protein [Leifsonia psychrotolerans]NYJ18925.1 putative membrane protein [Leifsonia psychrotolerans]